MGEEPVTRHTLRGQRGDEGDAAVPPGQRRVRPGRSPHDLERLFGEHRADPGREGRRQVLLGDCQDARVRRDAEQLRDRVSTAGGTATLTVGVLADSAEQAGVGLAAAFRQRHPHIEVQIRESDFTDPSAGLRGGLVDVALTRAPFDETGIRTIVLRSDPVGVVLRADDPLASRTVVRLPELTDRRWFQLPAGADPLWRAYWQGLPVGDEPLEGPVVRTVHECLQAVLWTETIGLTPLGHTLPDGLTTVPLADFPPSRLVVAWSATTNNPLARSFTRIAAETFGSPTPIPA